MPRAEGNETVQAFVLTCPHDPFVPPSRSPIFGDFA